MLLFFGNPDPAKKKLFEITNVYSTKLFEGL